MSECIEIIRAATEQLTLTLVKKPKEVKPVEDPKPEKKEKKSKPRPTEAPGNYDIDSFMNRRFS